LFFREWTPYRSPPVVFSCNFDYVVAAWRLESQSKTLHTNKFFEQHSRALCVVFLITGLSIFSMEALKIAYERCIKDWHNGAVFLIWIFKGLDNLNFTFWSSKQEKQPVYILNKILLNFFFTPLHYLLWFSYLGKHVKGGLIITQDWFKILNGNPNLTFWRSKQEKQQPVCILKKILLSFFYSLALFTLVLLPW
jgi:hypothetical protein